MLTTYYASTLTLTKNVNWILSNTFDRQLFTNIVHKMYKFIMPHLFVDHQMDAIATGRVDVVLQRRRPVVCVHHVTRLLVQVRDPLSELETSPAAT